jgi:hypothetical protein
VIVVADLVQAEDDLAAGRLTCPDCGGRLRGWGHARTRPIRQRAGAAVWVRPRRAHCPTCTRNPGTASGHVPAPASGRHRGDRGRPGRQGQWARPSADRR